MLLDPFREFSKISNRRANCAFEMSQCGFVVIAPIDDDHILVLHLLVKLSRRKLLSCQFVGIDVLLGFQSQGHDLFANLDRELGKNMILGRIDLELHLGGEGIAMHGIAIFLGFLVGSRDGSIDPFPSDNDAPSQVQRLAKFSVRLEVRLWVGDRNIAVVEQDLVGGRRCLSFHGSREGSESVLALKWERGQILKIRNCTPVSQNKISILRIFSKMAIISGFIRGVAVKQPREHPRSQHA